MLKSFYIILVMLIIGILFIACDTERLSTVEFIVEDEVFYTLDVTSDSLKIPNSPSKQGYIFDGWYLDENDYNKPFNIDSLLNTAIGKNIKVYAKWVEDTTELSNLYTVIFHSNGGSNVDNIEFSEASEFTIPSAPCREGYAFDGWYTDNQVFENEFEFEILPEQNLELFAKWVPNVYTVTFETSGGTISDNTIEIVYDSDYNLAVPEKTGYIFDGWYSLNNNYSLTGKWKFAGNITLQAKWIANEYDVILDVNGGDALNSDEITVSYESEYNLPEPNREGYDFVGWYTDTDNSFNIIGTYRLLNNIALHAVWQAKTYRLNINCNNYEAGSVTGSGDIQYNAQTTVTASTNAGYVFCGWYDNDIKLTDNTADDTDISYTFSMPANNITLTAKWEAQTYQITLNPNGGEALLSNTSEVVFGENFKIEQIPIRQYYIFDGWYSDDNGSVTQLTDGTGESIAKCSVSSEQELIALWIADYEDNYLICADDLANISLEKDYLMLCDIDFEGREWTPKGDMREKYSGIFDGGGHVLSNFAVSNTTNGNIGLFGSNEGVIKNLTICGFEYNINYNKVLYAGGITGYNAGLLLNCHARGEVYLSGKYAYSGGLVGLNFKGAITACSADVEINSSTTKNYAIYVGGLCGQNYDGNVANCYALGAVYGSGLSRVYAGGLVGDNHGAVFNSFSCGSVDAVSTENNATAGGLIGCNSSLIINCFASGDTSATAACASYCGALSGYNDLSEVVNCFHRIDQSVEGDNVCYTSTPTPLQSFQSESWIINILWKGYDIEFWSLPDSNFPILKSSADEIFDTFVEIETGAQLENVNGSVRNYNLISNIDLNETDWQPLIFGGNFYGNGNTINNFTVKANSYCGFFGYNTGKISNVRITNFSINANSSNTLLAGGVIGENNCGEVVNCYASGNITAASLYDISVGGLIGKNNKGTIINSYAEVDVLLNGAIIKGRGACGGLLGSNINGVTQGCYAKGEITITAVNEDIYDLLAGGLIGYDYYGMVIECYASGNLTVSENASDTVAGGLIGQKNSGKLSFSFAVGDISGTDSVLAGGLMGYSQNAKITGCFTVCCQCVICNTISEYCDATLQTNLQSEAFLTQIGYGKYISQNDLAANSDNVWVFTNNNYPKLYWQ